MKERTTTAVRVPNDEGTAPNRVEQLFQADRQPQQFIGGYLAYLSELFNLLDRTAVAEFIETLLAARERGAQIIFIGNGGSAATASHFANDIAIGTRSRKKSFRAISLADNTPVMTAIANDYGYDEIFAKLLAVHMLPGDVVVAISASGNSPNVVKAVEYANANGAVTVALTGFDGGKLRRDASLSVHIPTNKGEYGPTEDLHMVLDHVIGAYLMEVCRREGSL